MLGRLILAAGSRLMGADLAAIFRSARETADNIEKMLPKETCNRCGHHSHWLIPIVETNEWACHECMTKLRIACQQECGSWATVYAIDPIPGGWGGYYCEQCTKNLKFQVTDRL